MIFRLDGGISELLALTPVLAEWKRRSEAPVLVETIYPEILKGNPMVDEAADAIGDASMEYFNMDCVDWYRGNGPVMDTYASAILGDMRLRSRRITMKSTRDEIREARSLMPDTKRTVLISMGGSFGFPDDYSQNLMGEIEKAGWMPFGGGDIVFRSPGVFRAAVEMAEVFIGVDGDDAAIALTTDVPAVISYTYRSPVYFRPYRRGIPFEALPVGGLSRNSKCTMAERCFVENGSFEMGRFYGLRCPKEEKYVCKSAIEVSDIIEALERITFRLEER